MKPNGPVITQPWLSEPGLQAVFSAIATAGGEARCVGGCVRDALLGHRVRDVDLATDLEPEAVMKALRSAGLKAVPTGIDHGTVTAVAKGTGYEVTTLRVDVETHGRHATVAFTDDWTEDAARRDFTINALYCDANGQVYDPVGGLEDLKGPHIRFIGNAVARIEEDALRILRFFRFHAWYGEKELDPEGLAACESRRDMLDVLSVERVRHEMFRLLEAEDPAPTIKAMETAGILSHIGITGVSAAALDRLVILERAHAVPNGLRRLVAVMQGDAERIAALADQWKLSNAEKARLRGWAAADRDLHDVSGKITARAVIYRQGTQAVIDAALLSWAIRQNSEEIALEEAKSWTPPRFPLTGKDVLGLGVRPGKQVGQLLNEIERQWIEGGFEQSEDALRQMLVERVRRSVWS
ncbi:MAG: CCA tRNA nucleotidyltransferase [Alphaproteobacteria bacterium]|nr:CCA tRNA nucleotidyltransferase [Alphaproteobacteria bacterium]